MSVQEVELNDQTFAEGSHDLVTALIRRGRAILKSPLFYQILSIAAADLLVNLRLILEFNSNISIGNFVVPYSYAQYAATGLPGAWSRYQYLGIPGANLFLAQVTSALSFGPLWFLTTLVGPVGGPKLYIFSSVAALGISFLTVTKLFVRDYRAQTAAVLFLLLGPFQLQLYGQGDFVGFVALSFVFLSIYFAYRAVKSPLRRWAWFPLSIWTLAMSTLVVQLFLLGVLLYCCCLTFFVWESVGRQSFLLRLPSFAARLLALPLVLTPLILTFVYGAIDLGPGSATFLPLSSFQGNSASSLSILFLQSYEYSPSQYIGYTLIESINAFLASVWTDLTVALIVAIWVSYLLNRDRRLLFLFAVSVMASIWGAGPRGLLGPLTVYLYLHFPSYAALNQSYYWDWAIVAPALAIALGIAIEGSAVGHSGQCKHTVIKPERFLGPRRRRVNILFRKLNIRTNPSGGAVTILVALLVCVVAIPYGTQAQYNTPNGMHQVVYPKDYAEVAPELVNLIGESYAGVALFNPDINWFLANSTNGIPNTFFFFPLARTTGLPVYGSPAIQSNEYLYWVYEQFYTNSTKYVGELLGLVGVQYLLVFYNTQSASYYPYFLQFSYGKNASQLLAYQQGIEFVFGAKDFAIYRNMYYAGVASAASNLSLIAGDYSTLNSLSYAGINLTNQVFLFQNDLNPSTCGSVLGRTDRVYAASSNFALSLGLYCNYVSSAEPAAVASEGSYGWLSSQVRVGVSQADRWPSPVAIADAPGSVLSVPISVPGSCGSACTLWVPVRFTGDGGTLRISWQGQSIELRTDRGYQGLNNSMLWVGLPFLVASYTRGTLSFDSESGTNAVGTILVTNQSFASAVSVTKWLNTTFASKAVIYVEPGDTLDLVGPQLGSLGSGYFHLTTNAIAESSGIYLQALGVRPLAPISIPLPANGKGGWLILTLRTISYSFFNLTYDQRSRVLGFDSGNYVPSLSKWDTIEVYLPAAGGAGAEGVTLQLLNGTVWIAQTAYFPQTQLEVSTAGPPGLNLSVSGTYESSYISNLTLNVTHGAMNSTTITGSANLSATSYFYPYASITLNQAVQLDHAVSVEFSVTSGLELSLNGLKFGGAGGSGSVIFSPLFFSRVGSIGTNYTLTLEAYGGPTSSLHDSRFSVTLSTLIVSGLNRLTDLNSSVFVNVGADNSGYRVTLSRPASLLFVRVSFFGGMVTTPSSVSLAPALGSLTTIVWNPSDSLVISVGVAATRYLLVGYAVALSGTVAWVLIEYAMFRRVQKPRPAQPRSASR